MLCTHRSVTCQGSFIARREAVLAARGARGPVCLRSLRLLPCPVVRVDGQRPGQRAASFVWFLRAPIPGSSTTPPG